MLGQASESVVNNFAPLKVILPSELRNFYREAGYLSTTSFEERTNARLRVRTAGYIRFTKAPPCLQAQPGWRADKCATVLIKDLSRTGIGILYHEQIFPGEEFSVVLHNRLITAVVVRCRRIGENCYETGASILEVEPLSSNSSQKTS